MRHSKKNVLVVCLLVSLLLPALGAIERVGTYVVEGRHDIGISIESFYEKNGTTPLILSAAGLRLQLFMNEEGEVREKQNSASRHNPPLFTVDIAGSKILLEGRTLSFEVYEQNNVRTGLRLTGKNLPLEIGVDSPGGRVEFYIDGGRISFKHLTAVFKERSPGLLEMTCNGPQAGRHGVLLLDEQSGQIRKDYRRGGGKLLKRKKRQDPVNTSSTEANAIPTSERDALIALYSAAGGENWFDSSNWLGAAGTEGTWHGVTVADGHVVGIDLTYNNLNGTIPAELGNLSQLEVLCFDTNQLSGSIPSQLGNLSALRELLIPYNDLTGNIPAELGNLSNLVYLWLHSNDLSGSLPAQLGNLSNLEELLLSENLLTGYIPPELGNLSKLKWLWLGINQLSGTLPAELGNLPALLCLYLSLNQLTGEIPVEFGQLSELRYFEIAFNQLTGPIPDISALIYLETLYLNYNDLSGPIPALGNFTGLTDISLSHNRLSGAIPQDIGNLTNLWSLYLDSNKLKGKIPTTMLNLTGLYDFNSISWNALYTNDSALRDFLNSKMGDWQATQTTFPRNLSVDNVTGTSVTLSWTPIPYQADPGGYGVFYRTSTDEPYVLFGTINDKLQDQYTATWLFPETTYYFAVKSFTDPHADNENRVISNYSKAVEATTLMSKIQVTSPNGGESWKMGTVQNITWTSAGLSNNIRIVLRQNGTNVALIAKNIDPATGSYSWTVGDCLQGTVTPGSGYKVLIVEKDSPVKDASDSVFTIDSI